VTTSSAEVRRSSSPSFAVKASPWAASSLARMRSMSEVSSERLISSVTMSSTATVSTSACW
jgi:hypothetical protein